MRGHSFGPGAVVLCALGVCLASGAPAVALEAGAAKVDLALEPGVPLDGDFARRGRDAVTVHDPLYVRALYLEGDGVACFLVTADLFAITPDLRARVLEIAPEVVPSDNVILAATHTFSGPGGLDRSWLARQRGGRSVPELIDAIAMKFAEAMQLAYDARKRCAIGYASGDAQLGADRFAPGGSPAGNVTVLRIDDSDGNPIAIAANFGAAADSAARIDSSALSADFPGVFCDSLERMTATGTVAMYLNGGSADRTVSVPGEPVNWATVQTFGEALAARAKALANEITCRELPVQFAARAEQVPQNIAQTLLPDTATIQVLEVQRLAMIFTPAVPYAATAARLVERALAAGYTHVITAAPANGYFGAVAPEDRYTLTGGLGDPVYVDPAGSAVYVQQAAALLPRATNTAEDEPAAAASPAMKIREGLARFDEAGTSSAMGETRGASLRALYPDGLDSAVDFGWLDSVASTMLMRHWTLLRGAVDDEPMALAIASDDARRLAGALPAGSMERIAAMAESAGMPFQRLWLMQLAPVEETGGAHVSPIGVLFTLDTTANGIVVGQNIDYPQPIQMAVAQSSPRGGHAFVTIGFPWQPAGYGGVNERGVVLAAAPSARASNRSLAAPAETLFDDTLARAGTMEEALALLTVPREGITGRVLVAVDDGRHSSAVLVETGPIPVVLDMVPVDVIHRDAAAPTAKEARVARLLRGSNAATLQRAQDIASDRDRRAAETDRVLGATTRACAVFVPRERELYVMVPDGGQPRAYQRFVAGGEGS